MDFAYHKVAVYSVESSLLKGQLLVPAYIDSHCHFDFVDFDLDRAAVWHSCYTQGVQKLIIPGVAPAHWLKAQQICAALPGIYLALGIHPWWIAELQLESPAAQVSLRAQLLAAIESAGQYCVALGETGLDKTIPTPLALQQQLLLMQIELANALHKPLILHSVKTHSELLVLLKQHPVHGGGVLHAFSGSVETAQQFIDRGFLLGVGGTITYARAQKTRAALSKVPLAYLLLETDAPDMPLSGQQGQRNSPEYLPLIAQQLAELRGISVDEVALATSQNAQRLFNLP